MPRRERQRAANAACLPVHRYAFIQQLMHRGFMLESTALDSFEQLTGLSSSKSQKTAAPIASAAKVCCATSTVVNTLCISRFTTLSLPVQCVCS